MTCNNPIRKYDRQFWFALNVQRVAVPVARALAAVHSGRSIPTGPILSYASELAASADIASMPDSRERLLQVYSEMAKPERFEELRAGAFGFRIRTEDESGASTWLFALADTFAEFDHAAQLLSLDLPYSTISAAHDEIVEWHAHASSAAVAEFLDLCRATRLSGLVRALEARKKRWAARTPDDVARISEMAAGLTEALQASG